jgi:hypothetical protein
LLPKVWQDAEKALKAADQLKFVGYSLPRLGIHAERVFRRSIAMNSNLKWIDVANPAPQTAERYATLAAPVPVRWYPSIDALLNN